MSRSVVSPVRRDAAATRVLDTLAASGPMNSRKLLAAVGDREYLVRAALKELLRAGRVVRVQRRLEATRIRSGTLQRVPAASYLEFWYSLAPAPPAGESH